MLGKPGDVFGRDGEWADLAAFADSALPGLRMAIVYGRRRQGKSYLLRRLADATGGLYHLATEQTESISLRRFGRTLTDWFGLQDPGASFESWEAGLGTALRLMAGRSPAPGSPRAQPLLVLDEFPYLERQTPGLPSIVQSLYDDLGPGSSPASAALRLVLCGSAISVMSDLLAGTRALRGRAALELRIMPFGYRESREYWSIEPVATAFAHNALIGGTPGYRDIVPEPAVPTDIAGLGGWMMRNVLRPAMPLFDEGLRVVHEDPRMRDTAVYASLLAAIAAGESSPAKIGGLLGRPSTSLSYQLGMLESAGFISRHGDLLRERRPVIAIADPLVRLHHLVIEPSLADLEAGRARQVWARAEHAVESAIYGPHFERLARQWLAQYGAEEAGLNVGPVGQSVIACPEHRVSHEIDVLALAPGTRPRATSAPIAFIGEAKYTIRRPGMTDLRRLEHIRDLLSTAGHDAGAAVIGLFSMSGFTRELIAEAANRNSGHDDAEGQVLLADLDRLYGVD